MKLQAETGDVKHDVEVTRDGGKVVASVDGRTYELEVSEPEPGVYLFNHGGKVSEIFVAPRGTNAGPFNVQTRTNLYEINLVDPKRLRGSGGGGDHSDGAADLRTAMPGKVVRVLVEAGAEVQKGDGVVVVEAMKMQNELKAPKAGIVKEIKFAEGSTVGAGDVLVVIE